MLCRRQPEAVARSCIPSHAVPLSVPPMRACEVMLPCSPAAWSCFTADSTHIYFSVNTCHALSGHGPLHILVAHTFGVELVSALVQWLLVGSCICLSGTDVVVSAHPPTLSHPACFLRARLWLPQCCTAHLAADNTLYGSLHTPGWVYIVGAGLHPAGHMCMLR